MLIDLLQYFTNLYSNNKNTQKQHILLLGDGFVSRGFLKNIDHSRFSITQISSHGFLNPQDFFLKTKPQPQPQPKFLDFFCHKPDKIIATITNIELTRNNGVNLSTLEYGQLLYGFDYMVVGLGNNKPLYQWKFEIDQYKLLSGKNVSVLGMGPTGIEIAGILSANNTVNLYEMLTYNNSLSYLSKYSKNLLIDRLRQKKIGLNFENVTPPLTDIIIKCVGNTPNTVCNDISNVDEYLHYSNNIYVAGDCAKTPFPKTAECAEAMGKYIAQNINNDNKKINSFTFKSNGTALVLGTNEVLIDNNKYLYNAIYPNIILELYSYFCV